MSKFSTDDLIFWLGLEKTNSNERNFRIDEIIARIRAADALCEAAEDSLYIYQGKLLPEELDKAVRAYKEA